jgi:hypothetical protein
VHDGALLLHFFPKPLPVMPRPCVLACVLTCVVVVTGVQTGCGKTHTMQGRESPPELRGIIPNSFDHIFEAVKITTHKEFLIRCAYLEIYNEEVRDLLGDDPLKRLELKEDPSQGVFVKDLVFVEVASVEAIDKVMRDGYKNRTVGATLMNAESSRSHSIFTVVIEMGEKRENGEDHFTKGKVCPFVHVSVCSHACVHATRPTALQMPLTAECVCTQLR